MLPAGVDEDSPRESGTRDTRACSWYLPAAGSPIAAHLPAPQRRSARGRYTGPTLIRRRDSARNVRDIRGKESGQRPRRTLTKFLSRIEEKNWAKHENHTE